MTLPLPHPPTTTCSFNSHCCCSLALQHAKHSHSQQTDHGPKHQCIWAPCEFCFSSFFFLLTILITFLDYNYLVTMGPAPPSRPMLPLRAPAHRVTTNQQQQGWTGNSQRHRTQCPALQRQQWPATNDYYAEDNGQQENGGKTMGTPNDQHSPPPPTTMATMTGTGTMVKGEQRQGGGITARGE